VGIERGADAGAGEGFVNHGGDVFGVGMAFDPNAAGRGAEFADGFDFEIARLENPREFAGEFAGFVVVRES